MFVVVLVLPKFEVTVIGPPYIVIGDSVAPVVVMARLVDCQ